MTTSRFAIPSRVTAAVAALALLTLGPTAMAPAARADTGPEPTFAAAASYATDINPESVAIGDVNGDGHPDVITANSASDTVTVLLGTGTGAFELGIPYSVSTVGEPNGTQPVSVALGDVNGDGHPDIVTADSGTTTEGLAWGVSILTNKGDGSFGTPRVLPAGANPLSVALGDLDGDGVADIVTANGGAEAPVALFSSTKFAIPVTLPGGAATAPVFVALGDLDGAGGPDLVTANAGSASVSVYLNDNGTFAEPTVLADVDMNPTESAALGDVNDDGFNDIVASMSGANMAGLWLGTGDGAFIWSGNYELYTDEYPTAISLGDVNDDEYLDIVTANSGTDDVTVLLGNGDATFGYPIAFALSGSAPTPMSLGIADFDADNRLDIVTANGGSEDISVLLNTTVQPTPPTPTPPTPPTPVTPVAPHDEAIETPEQEAAETPEEEAAELAAGGEPVVHSVPLTTVPTAGHGDLVVDGRATDLSITRDREHSNVALAGAGATMSLHTDTSGGTQLPLGSDGNLLVSEDGTAAVQGTGFHPQTWVTAYLFSEPTFVGNLLVAADGSLDGSVPMPAGLQVGRHTLQVNGTTTKDDALSVTFAITMVSPVIAASYTTTYLGSMHVPATSALRPARLAVPITAIVRDAASGGLRASEAMAIELNAECGVKASIVAKPSGKVIRPLTCMHYNAARDRFEDTWHARANAPKSVSVVVTLATTGKVTTMRHPLAVQR